MTAVTFDPTVTLPEGGLAEHMPAVEHDYLLAWLRRNGINPNAVTADRPVHLGIREISRWEIVPRPLDDPETPAGFHRSDGINPGYGQIWSSEDPGAVLVRWVATPYQVPLPEHLRAELKAALKLKAAASWSTAPGQSQYHDGKPDADDMPWVGAIVHDSGTGECLPAIVAKVHAPEVVDLVVFAATVTETVSARVRRPHAPYDPIDPEAARPAWHWLHT
ncbi:hypothetical protein [Kribbella deserti]|uniref:DUF317 domain-containing protein n=1 Tax=Kribbella deserti TaxID=1926257 RepID=A0ABV6QNE6_9ACTN